jgi:hypothetical protein
MRGGDDVTCEAQSGAEVATSVCRRGEAAPRPYARMQEGLAAHAHGIDQQRCAGRRRGERPGAEAPG